MKRIAGILTIFAIALSSVETSYAGNTVQGKFLDLITSAARKSEFLGCKESQSEKLPSDGGPICRNFIIKCAISIPINDADKMNGISERKFIRTKYIWYGDKWYQLEMGSELLRDQTGWQVESIARDDMFMAGSDECK
ncbi:MAG: hypothetical protein ACXU8U_02020 [Asticcacaulis sp.]